MKRIPDWAKDTDGPRIEQTTSERLAREAAQARVAWRGIETLPLDHEAARIELSDEQRALRLPTHGGRKWRAVTAFDERVEAIQKRQEKLRTEAAVMHAQLASAQEADTRRLANWHESGGQGERPEPEKPTIEDELTRIEMDVQALDQLIDEVLDAKERHVTRHREKLSREAAADLDRARDNYLRAARELETARSELVEARRTSRWARYYPGEEATRDRLNPEMVAGGLLRPVQTTLQTSSQVAFANLAAALAADADALVHGIPDDDQAEPDVRKQAVWESSSEGQSALAREKARIVAGVVPKNLHQAGWEADE